jgi:hypothetical protein
MTEAEWLACDDPSAMLEALTGKASARKLRLLACATCWDHSPPFPHPAVTEELTVAERYADGEATEQERAAAFVANVEESLRVGQGAGWEHFFLVGFAVGESSGELGTHLRNRASGRPSLAAYPSTIRCIFGIPFRLVTFDPEWRTTTAVQLAQGIYDSRDFSALPILADALQDAECDTDDILDHCRGPGSHVRGCWVVDLVLGKE